MNDDDDLDPAFRAALATAVPAEDPQATQRRRQVVLAAVDAALAPAPTLPAASNEAQWRTLPSWWRGAAAACVLVCSALIVARLAEPPPPPAPQEVAPATAPPVRQEALRELSVPPSATVSRAAPLDRVATLPPVPPAPETPAIADRAAKVQPPPAATEGLAIGRLQAAAPRAATLASAPGLLAAARQGDTEAMRRILARRGPDDERDADGRTALTLAVLRADVAMASLLLQQGADRLAADRFGQTAQGYAIAAGDPALLKAFGLAP
jgi:hypothetical protein